MNNFPRGKLQHIEASIAASFVVIAMPYLYSVTLTNNNINTIQDYFKDKPVLKAFLFGSYACKEASADIDIDILIELDYSQHIGLGFVSMKLDLEEKLGKKIDLIPAMVFQNISCLL